MDFYINLRVNFRGNSKNFLLSGSETKSWESMEAMVRGPLSNSSGHTITHRFTRMTQVCFVFRRRKAEVTLLNAFVTAWLRHIYNMPVQHLGSGNVRMAHTPRQVDRTVAVWDCSHCASSWKRCLPAQYYWSEQSESHSHHLTCALPKSVTNTWSSRGWLARSYLFKWSQLVTTP